MEALRAHLDLFLRSAVPALLSRPPQEAAWHFSFNCERCSYCDHCRDEMRRTEDVSQLTNLTAHGKRHLVQLGVRTRPELEQFLKRDDADDLLDGSASLAGERHYLESRLAAFRQSRPVPTGSAAALPKGENVAVFLVLQREPIGRTTYLVGVLVHAKAELAAAIFSPPTRAALFDAAGRPQPCVMVAERPEEVLPLRGRFVRLLYQALAEAHAYNRGREWNEQISL
jgi:predicted RecB family nuclease